MKHFLLTLFLILLPLQFGFLYLKNPPQPPGTVAGIKSQAANVENSVSIGEFRFSLYGYTSPKAQVTFEGLGIFDQTTADSQGYFKFNNRFSPFSSREACLSSKDQFGRLSSPLCLPPFPVNYNVSIGPVIMPPTLSLDKQDYFIGDQVILSGQAVPNTDVKLSMFGDRRDKFEALNYKSQISFNLMSFPPPIGVEGRLRRESKLNIPFKNVIIDWIPVPACYALRSMAGRFTGMTNLFETWDLGFRISNFSLIKSVEAFTFPQLNTTSDAKGNFSINLPSSGPEKFRLFAQTDFKKSISPNSVKLNLEILPVWMIIIKFFLFLFSLLQPRLLEILIILEIIYILYILEGHFQKKTIVLYQNHLPAIEENRLPILI